MRRRAGMLEDFAAVVDPRHTALLVLDMQNDFCAPGGKVFDSMGPQASAIRFVIAPLQRLLELGRQFGLLRIFVQTTHLKGGVDESPAYVASLKKKGFQSGDEPNVVVDSWGHRIIDDLAVAPGEIAIQKFSYDAFHNSLLDAVLRNHDIRTVLLCGAASYGVVLTTARTAACRGYYVHVIGDSVAGYSEELHRAALALMRHELVATEDLIQAWSARGTK
jgi:nicotinamidase-related amidase